MQKPCKTVQAVRVMRKKLFVSCKKTCKLFHMSCKNTSCSTCEKNKLFHMQKPCKTVKKPTCQNDMSLCSCKNHAKTMQNAARTERQPSLSPGSLLYVLYVLYLTRQATEHPLSPGSLLYVLYVLYLTRQATEHPLSPGSLLYVLYVLYGIEACVLYTQHLNMYQICIV